MVFVALVGGVGVPVVRRTMYPSIARAGNRQASLKVHTDLRDAERASRAS
jgi:hypothetical protein